MFCARPGTSFPPRVIRIAPASTIAITIHIVTIVSLMLGENTISPSGGCGPITVCGAGKCNVLSMKQTGKEQASPGTPPLGNGGKRMNAKMSTMMTAPIRRNHREDSPRPDVASGAGAVPDGSATGSVAACSLDTLPPHTGARHVAALGPFVPAASAGYSIVLRNLLTSR